MPRPDRDGRPRQARRVARDTEAASAASTPVVRRRMQGQQARDTGPERALRRLLHAAGLRYRVDRAPLPGLRRRADLVFGPARLAVFVDGCFWHGCPEHGTRPRTNAAWWQAKLERNRRRDADTDARLQAAGWRVVRVWEHDDPAEAAARVGQTVSARRARTTALGAGRLVHLPLDDAGGPLDGEVTGAAGPDSLGGAL